MVEGSLVNLVSNEHSAVQGEKLAVEEKLAPPMIPIEPIPLLIINHRPHTGRLPSIGLQFLRAIYVVIPLCSLDCSASWIPLPE